MGINLGSRVLDVSNKDVAGGTYLSDGASTEDAGLGDTSVTVWIVHLGTRLVMKSLMIIQIFFFRQSVLDLCWNSHACTVLQMISIPKYSLYQESDELEDFNVLPVLETPEASGDRRCPKWLILIAAKAFFEVGSL